MLKVGIGKNVIKINVGADGNVRGHISWKILQNLKWER